MEYRIYITNALQCISKNTAQYEGCTYMQLSYLDMIYKAVPEPSRSSEEIISSISSTLDFLGKEYEE